MLERIYFEPIKEEIYTGVIKGLRTYVIPKKGYTKSFAMLTIKFGSNDIEFEKKGEEMKEYPKGIAHFLEHKLFEEEEGNIFNRFAELGASPNAYTNFQITTYYFTSTEGFNENLELLVKFVYNPYLTEENVNKEKGIIEQEIRMYEDNPGFRVYYNALECMYNSHPVRYDIAGTVESIYEITPELLYDCYNTFYVPENMIMTIVGDVNIQDIVRILERTVPNNRNKADYTVKEYSEEPKVNKHMIRKKMGLSIPNFIIGFKDEPKGIDKNNYIRRKVQMDILCRLLFSRSSSLYESLYNSGLINESFSYEYTLEKDYCHLIIGGESRDPEKVMEEIRTYIRNNKSAISSEDFQRVKKTLVGSFITRFNNIEGLGNFIKDYFIRGVNPFDYYEVLKDITEEKIIERLQYLNGDERWAISIID
ncbi:EF-P 5-aminopentanol modification-associated protein YfmH [Clostridium thermarum]|uniref:EF-P 5-aminopentanol modification-associated protein YfmH n=1 Tax=Clostridium thermarum TaxID=1716543 RepID=UPI0013D37F8B|nr:pitrilysin family protein [Clostridium thermarum]